MPFDTNLIVYRSPGRRALGRTENRTSVSISPREWMYMSLVRRVSTNWDAEYEIALLASCRDMFRQVRPFGFYIPNILEKLWYWEEVDQNARAVKRK
jgi:hypothetical protein